MPTENPAVGQEDYERPPYPTRYVDGSEDICGQFGRNQKGLVVELIGKGTSYIVRIRGNRT